MKVVLSDAHFDQIKAHLEDAYPNEGAGFLLGRSSENLVEIEFILPMANRRETEAQHNRYSIEPNDYAHAEFEAARRGLNLVGVFHSHPDHPARPSKFDLDHAWPNFSYFISTVEKGKVTVTHAWRLREDRTAFDEDLLELAQPNSVANTNQEE
jgi:proteasome lid subunit RPN8/RPN11